MGIILFVVVFASITPPIYAMSQGQNPIRMFVNQILKQNMEPKPVLGESKNSLPVEQKIQIVSNEFLVKFKSNRANNLRLRYEQSGKKGLNNTSNQQLDTTGSRAGLKNIEPVLKNQAGLKQKSQKVREKADKLNRWYKVQINVPKKTFDLSRDDFSTLLADPDFKKYLLLYRAYQASEEVEAVEHNYIYSLNVIPNDPKFPEMWGLTKINAASAWDQSTGLGVVVADIDTGINYNHPDLKDAIWINPAESGSTTQEGPTPNCTSRGLALNKSCNNIDDDGNGYVDDYRGWDFYNNDNNPIDDHGHGTHTSGTIAALGNNGLGVIGVSWNSKILPLKICNYLGSCPLDSVIKAISYSADLGVKVSSNSYGGSFSQSINDAMQYAHSKGQVIVASAGNNAADAMLNSPASAAQAITVASSNQSDTKSLFSNFGSKIDVTAPGESILSTCINSNYCLMSGTSMSAPHVSGLAALILAKNPSLTNEEVRQIIRSGADDVEIAGRDNNSGYGRINALKSLNLASAKPTTPFISSPTQGQNLSLANGAQLIPVMGTVTGSNFASYKLEIVGTEGGSWNTLASGTSQIATDSEIAKLDLTKLGDGKYTLKLSATNTQGNTFNNQVNIEVHNMDLSITYPNGIVSNSQFDIVGTASGKAGSAFSRYLLEWGVGISPASWFANGIILANNGTQSITNGTLGTFDPTVLPNSGSGYTLRLTVYNNFQIPSFRKVSFQPEAGLVNGWPKPYGTVDPYNWTSDPVVTDLDGDAKPEFITSAMWTNKLYAFRANGDAVPGWPVTLPGIGNAAPAVSDLDGDGKAEVVVNSSWMSSNVKGLLVFKGDGTPYPGWNSPVEFVPALNTPALADIDNDGKKEIINNNCGVHVYKLDGSELPGWPVLPKSPITVNCGGELFNSPVVADIDGDGYKEIIADRRVGSDSNMHKISVFRYNGQLMWEKDTNFSNISPAVADLDGDGKLEVAWQQRGSTGIQVFKHDGSNYPGAPFNITEASAKGGYLTMVDLDGDGKSEIISPTTTTRFVVLDYQGKLASGWDIPILIAFDGWNTASFGDFDGDGKLELGVSGYNGNSQKFGVYIFKQSSGVVWSREYGESDNAPILGDFDGDGKTEVLAQMLDENLNFYMYYWQVNQTTKPKHLLWNQLGATEAHPKSYLGPRVLKSPCETYGDVNGDGKVNDTDKQWVSEAVIGRRTLTLLQRFAADVYYDRTISGADALSITKYVAGIDSTFKACVNAKNLACSNYGDVTKDGSITYMDADWILGYAVGLITFDDDQKKRADVYPDQQITSADSLQISKYLSGSDTTFKVCSPTPTLQPTSTPSATPSPTATPTSIPSPTPSPTTQATCTDTDGKDIYVKGSTYINGNLVATESCNFNDNPANTQVLEYWCPSPSSTTVSSEWTVCPKGCSNGACIP